ncbi:MAG TPA: amino acid adenylation domain-containing protein [Iamia sp.]
MRDLASRVAATARAHPDRPALAVDDTTLTYTEMWAAAARLAGALQEVAAEGPPLVAVLAQRSRTAYLGILGALASGRGYVPLHPGFPAVRTASMRERSGARAVVVGPEALPALADLVAATDGPLAVVLPDVDRADVPAPLASALAAGGHTVLDRADVAGCTPLDDPVPVSDDAVAYLLFTSGSTGVPKGVAVSQANVSAYLDHVVDAYAMGPGDRASQMFDLTFDLSVHDLFATWSSGAALHVVPAAAVMAPAKLIRAHELTLWFSVPSVAMVMARLRMLKPGAFPSLRASLFCGEPLPSETARRWIEAAPGSVVDNLYGPTEATIAITSYRVTAAVAEGVVPLGRAFPGQRTAVVGPDLEPVASGEVGELLLGGTQVTAGYLADPERTAQQFVTPAALDGRWYRTGDLVHERDSVLHYRGRVDDQVQVNGFRVELQEVDVAVRAAAGVELAAAVAWSSDGGPRADAVYAFVADPALDEAAVVAGCRDRLPAYMVPTRVLPLDDLPLNANGKIDRRALGAILREQLGA